MVGSGGQGTKNGGRRNGRPEDTERAIIRAATRLFSERGYNGTSIADLAGTVNVRNASLYYHISSKQGLLLRVLEDGMSGLLAGLEEICATDLPERDKLRLAIENHLAFIFDRGDAVAVFLRERRFLEKPQAENYRRKVDRYDVLFTAILKRGIASGEFPRVDARITSLAILGMINWVTEWHRPHGRLSPRQLSRIFLDLILGRLLATSARPRAAIRRPSRLRRVRNTRPTGRVRKSAALP